METDINMYQLAECVTHDDNMDGDENILGASQTLSSFIWQITTAYWKKERPDFL